VCVLKKTRFFGIVCTEQEGGGEESNVRSKGRCLSAGWRCSARPLSASRRPAHEKIITQQSPRQSPSNRIESKIPNTSRAAEEPDDEKREESSELGAIRRTTDDPLQLPHGQRGATDTRSCTPRTQVENTALSLSENKASDSQHASSRGGQIITLHVPPHQSGSALSGTPSFLIASAAACGFPNICTCVGVEEPRSRVEHFFSKDGGVLAWGSSSRHLRDSDGMQPRFQHRPYAPEDHGRVDQVDLPHLPESNQIKSLVKR
jgi:hypothetical protein